MKQLLLEFVNWLEAAHFHGCPCGSAFEQQVPPHTIDWADAALDFALSSQRPVVLYTRSSSARAVIAGLVLHRAGVNRKNVYNGDLNDGDFHRLETWLARMNKADVVIEEDLPRISELVACHMSGGRYVFVC